MRVAVALAVWLVTTPRVAAADCELKLFPLPVWATDPNEGNTYGVMPVLLSACTPDGANRTGSDGGAARTTWLLAPSATWNDIIHVTGTVRWYAYPDDDTTISVLASASTRIARRAIATWSRAPTAPWSFTDDLVIAAVRDPFARFFGIGPDSSHADETSYTALKYYVTERAGVALSENFDVGVVVGVEHDEVEDDGVPGLPPIRQLFPRAPGIAGASLISEGLDIRYDDRHGRQFADSGTHGEIWLARVQGLAGSPDFTRVGAQVDGIVPELEWLATAARFYASFVSSAEAPFYQQSSLGGAFLLRGFQAGRFIDRGAWTAEVEERVRLARLTWFGVTSDVRVDPFVTVGQVFDDVAGVLSHPRVAAGVGLRAWVHPRVLGRIDLAYGGEGIATYVEIGYPY